MFYLIGIGLNLESISLEALEALKSCEKIYMESYTVELPYKIEELHGLIEEVLKKRIIHLTRIMVEGEKFLEEARDKNIALLVYGSPLTATTHISLILKCRKENIKYRVLHNASILDAISETGLQAYKFGKITSMPAWKDNYKPDSFIDIIKDNLKIKAHTLILVDIGLSYPEALRQLEEAASNKLKLDKIIVCSQLGTEKSRIFYEKFQELAGREIYAPFCFIIPSSLHFLEEEALESL